MMDTVGEINSSTMHTSFRAGPKKVQATPTGSSMGVRIDISDSVEACFDDWRRRWLGQPRDPFLHPGWPVAFVQAHKTRVATMLLGVREGGRLVGMLPMRRDRDGVLRFLTSPRSDYEDVLFCADRRDAVLACLAEFLIQERFELAEVPEES